jgi:general secretion pathway protein D
VLDRGVDVASASPMQIQYDPKLLNLVDVTMGDLFAKTDSPVFARNIMNDMGLANIQLSTKQGAAGVTGAGPMLNLRFQALAPGTTTITGLNVTLRNSQGMAVGSGSPQVAVEIK